MAIKSSPLAALAARSAGLNRRYGLAAKPRKPRVPAAPADPYSAIIAGLPKPLTPGQITSQAKGQISPLVAAITGQIQQQTQAATHAIGGYTQDAAAKLAAVNFEQPYQDAQVKQAAVDAALRQQLAGQGSTDADQLAQRLGVLNDPAVAKAAAAVSANGAASGATQLAQGSAALGGLIANAAAAGSYGQKLPGIERLAGLQQLARLQQQAQANIADQTSQIEQQLPSIISDLTSRNDQRASAIASARQNQLARQDALATTAANNAAGVQKAKVSAAASVQKAQIQAAEKATAAQVSKARSDRSYRLQFAKTFGYDPVTNKVTPGFKRTADGALVKVSTSKSGANGQKPLTASAVQSFTSGLVKQTKAADGSITTTYKTTFPRAYKYLRSNGVPDEKARAALATVYPRGSQGRAWLTNEEQTVLRQAKTRLHQPGFVGLKSNKAQVAALTKVHTFKGLGYLTPMQLTVLRKAGRAPKVEAGAPGGGFWIDPNG